MDYIQRRLMSRGSVRFIKDIEQRDRMLRNATSEIFSTRELPNMRREQEKNKGTVPCQLKHSGTHPIERVCKPTPKPRKAPRKLNGRAQKYGADVCALLQQHGFL